MSGSNALPSRPTKTALKNIISKKNGVAPTEPSEPHLDGTVFRAPILSKQYSAMLSDLGRNQFTLADMHMVTFTRIVSTGFQKPGKAEWFSQILLAKNFGVEQSRNSKAQASFKAFTIQINPYPALPKPASLMLMTRNFTLVWR